jgi:protein-S-isoprenylcysteine O-methyltransferase
MAKMCLAKTVFAVFTLLVTGCLTAWPQTNATAIATVPTQVVIIGTIHDGHRANTNYSLDILRNLIVKLKPSAILIELPPEINGWPTVQNGRVTNGLVRNECVAANQAADALGVKVIPFDQEGRNEFYRKTGYLTREKAAYEHLNNWIKAQTRKDADSIQVHAARLASDAMAGRSRINASGRPEDLNSPAYDMLVATKHGMFDDVLPKLLVVAGERELAEEYHFLTDVWQERNRTMARNIQDIARTFTGKRLVVLTGSEHRYILRELLGKVPELELKEFYQVPDWTGSARPPASFNSVVRRHVPMTLKLLLVLAFVWFVLERCLTRRSGPDATSKDQGSRMVLMIVQMVAIGCGIMAAYYLRAYGLPARNFFSWFGLCVFLMGVTLRLYSIIYLGHFFTNDVAVATNHRLIDSGPYRFIRHPSYTGALMGFFGLGLGMGNWLSVAVIIVPIFAAFWWRMEIEEAVLLEALGEPYRSYMKRTKRLVPMIY